MLDVFDENYENRHILIGETQDDFMSRFVRSNFRECFLDLYDPDFLFMKCSVFRNSTIRVYRKGIRLFWPGCLFESCVFTGEFCDTRFGIFGDERDGCANRAGLEDCDFSLCSLHLCSFYNCDPKTLKFPKWPNITVLHPQKNEGDWLAIPFPARFRVFQEVITYSRESQAATIHWPTYAQEENDSTDPEFIRQLLVGKNYIVM